ncbi:class I SAM-dependent methyltransferase [Bacillus sp. 165]|uniref:class I SAM-dependent methyltransferase n=1 Tax=Bacillus sp. 165 TaxID=1529117 RepID=UPI001ADBEEF9|nr:class I SAM-dependent methyltransferase [Bacillus sp. 165]MBO9129079.1 methyltransferase domain-containing protein [Bacillus sp. 165]
MKAYTYLDFIALLGVGSAHPGGFSVTKNILRNIGISKNTKVLDAGCGTGKTAAYIAQTYGCFVTAIDNHPVMLEKANKRFQRLNIPIKLIQANIEKLPFSHNCFDLILSESVTAFTNIPSTIQEYSRTLKEKGIVIAIEMTAERPLATEEKSEIHSLYKNTQLLTEQEWIKLWNENGFSSVRVIGGGTIASSLQQLPDEPEFDISPDWNDEMYQLWSEHEYIMQKYGHVLGHRIFLCTKAN